MENRILDLYFVRHAESLGNAGLPYPGFHIDDPPLSDHGLLQARALAARFAPGDLDHIYASTLVRTCQTVQPTAEKLGMRIKLLPELMEFGTEGCGTPPDKIRALAPAAAEEAQRIHLERKDYTLFGEDFDAAEKRAEFAVRFFLDTYSNGERILVASHGTFFGYLLRASLGMRLPEPFAWQVDNCAVTGIRFRRDDVPILLCANDISHFYL